MEIRAYLAILARRKWVIAVTLLATLLAGLIGTALLPRTYEGNYPPTGHVGVGTA